MGDSVTSIKDESMKNNGVLNGSYSKTIIGAYDRVRHVPLDESHSLVESQGLSLDKLTRAVSDGKIHVYEFDSKEYLDRLDIGRIYHRPAQERVGLTIERYFS